MIDEEELNEKKQVLVVDDDQNICFAIETYLKGMDYGVESVYSGKEGLKKALSKKYDAVILDVMLPGIDGFEVLKELRKESNVPVIMLTSRDDVTDKVVGLEMGADDYLPKTFEKRELLARLRAVIRGRSLGNDARIAEPPMKIVFGDLEIDTDSHEITIAGSNVELTPIEYGLLLILAKSAGKVVSRDQLLNSLSGRDYESFDRAIDNHISSLRKKLDDNVTDPRYIKTVRSSGYMFIPTRKK